jgi:hypothetical protein
MRGFLREVKRKREKGLAALGLCAALLLSTFSFAQEEARQANAPASASSAQPARDYPKEIRGYKVELANVEVKQQAAKDSADSSPEEASTDSLLQLGQPRVKRLTPLGVTLEVPVTVAPVKQGGRVDFLTFEDMVVNGTTVTVSEYNHSFDLPNDHPVTLPEPVTIEISTPRAMLSVLGEWNKPKQFWPVTGRVYVFGHFKKFLFKFKRVVPVELNISFRNPLKSSDE